MQSSEICHNVGFNCNIATEIDSVFEVRTAFLRRLYSGLLAFLMAFTVFGNISTEVYFGGDIKQNDLAVQSFAFSSDHLQDDKHSLPMEGEDDVRAEEDENEDDEISKALDPFASLNSRNIGYAAQILTSANAQLHSREGRRIPLFVRYHCWKFDLNG